MVHKVILEISEERLRLDYQDYLHNKSTATVDTRSEKKAKTIPINKILSDKPYLRSFEKYGIIEVMREPFIVELKLKNK